MQISTFFKHCFKNHIMQFLDYHGKLQNKKQILSFHHLSRLKQDGISHLPKIQNKKHNQKTTDVFNKQDVTVYFIY